MADPEFEPLRVAFPQLNTCGADEHAPEIKRFIQTVKVRVRSVYHSLPYKYIPRLFLVHLVKAAIFWLNAFSHRDRISDHLPRYIMTGHTMNFQHHARLQYDQHTTRRRNWILPSHSVRQSGPQLFAFLTEQMSAKCGLKQFGKRRADAIMDQ